MNQDGNDPDNPDISKQPPIGSRAAREQHQEQRVRQRGWVNNDTKNTTKIISQWSSIQIRSITAKYPKETTSTTTTPSIRWKRASTRSITIQ